MTLTIAAPRSTPGLPGSRGALALIAALASAPPALARQSPLLPDSVITALATEVSGQTARRVLDEVTQEHRVRGSRGWHRAGEIVRQRLLAYGLADARIETFPADGKRYYGTTRSRPPWDADFAELWTLRREGQGWVPEERLASWDAMPVSLAEDSEGGDVTAALVDVGAGTAEADYAGKDVRGKLVLAGAQADAVARLAVEKYGAAGIVSAAQNQRTAWWGEDESLVRWGHLDTFAAKPTFAFMVSLRQARALRERLARGEEVRLHAVVRAGRHEGGYEVVTATIPGADPGPRNEEIGFSCHLDHQRPGANDNASGCVAILEAARTLSTLIGSGKLARPARTLRFTFPPEIEGTIAFLTTHPEIAARLRAVIHMDMVGGGPVTKAIFHVTRGPASLPSFVYDVGAAFGALVNRESDAFASTGQARWPLVSPEGGKEALLAELGEFTMGSDHEVYTDGSYGIPAIYMNDWPDRYIHTNADAPANIDPTKLERAAFIGAASAYYLATLGPSGTGPLLALLREQALRRTALMLERRAALPPAEAGNLTRFHFASERAIVASVSRFAAVPPAQLLEANNFLQGVEQLTGGAGAPAPTRTPGEPVWDRNPAVVGPISGQGGDYLIDRLGREAVGRLRLLGYEGLRGSGGEYGYEVLNLVSGKRTSREIRDAVSAIYGPVPLELVEEFLTGLEAAGVVRRLGR